MAELAAVVQPFTERTAQRGTVEVHLAGVKVSWFRYDYGLLQPLKKWRGVELLTVPDLAAMKLAAIQGRSTRRDFIDIYTILEQTTLTLPELLGLFIAKFPRANLQHLVDSLVYFDEADRERMPVTFIRATWATIKKRIRAAVGSLGEK